MGSLVDAINGALGTDGTQTGAAPAAPVGNLSAAITRALTDPPPAQPEAAGEDAPFADIPFPKWAAEALRPRQDPLYSGLPVDTLGQFAGDRPAPTARMTPREAGRLLATTGGAIGGGALGMVAPPGAQLATVPGGAGLGSAAAGQLYDAALDAILGTQERSDILSGQTALDVGAGAAGPIVASAARPIFSALSGVTRTAASRVEGAIERAVTAYARANPARATTAEINAATQESERAAAQAYQEAMAGGVTRAEAEDAATQAGQQAAREYARGVWQEAEAAGRVPPKVGGKPRKAADFPEVYADAQTAADLASEAARLRTLRTTRTAATPEEAEAAREAARHRVLDAEEARLQALTATRGRGSPEAAEAGRQAATQMARRLTGVANPLTGGALAGMITGDVTTAGGAFLALQGLRGVQRFAARQLLQSPTVRRFVLDRGLAFGTPTQAATSFAALAADNRLTEHHREAARELERAIIAGDRTARLEANRRIQVSPKTHFVRNSGVGPGGNAPVPMVIDKRTNRAVRKASPSDLEILGGIK